MKKKVYIQPLAEFVSLQTTAMILAGSNITINTDPIPDDHGGD
jgi:hypothetical protein